MAPADTLRVASELVDRVCMAVDLILSEAESLPIDQIVKRAA